MKRREFLKTSVAATGAAALTSPFSASAGAHLEIEREFYEIRNYKLKSQDDQSMLDGFLEKALIPALNRIGSNPVGVFTETEGKDEPGVYVLIPYSTIEAFATSTRKLFSDAAFLAAGKDYLETPKSNPGFVRINSWLLSAFKGQPKITLPDYCKEKKDRIFELRTYESYSEAKALKKVDMFNAGEIKIMHDVGLGPIFFGQTLLGPNVPHLMYMTSATDLEAHKKHWPGFSNHPLWEKLKADPQYADTVSKNTSRFLAPTTYSQI